AKRPATPAIRWLIQSLLGEKNRSNEQASLSLDFESWLLANSTRVACSSYLDAPPAFIIVWSLESRVWSQRRKEILLLTSDSRLQTPDSRLFYEREDSHRKWARVLGRPSGRACASGQGRADRLEERRVGNA